MEGGSRLVVIAGGYIAAQLSNNIQTTVLKQLSCVQVMQPISKGQTCVHSAHYSPKVLGCQVLPPPKYKLC